MHNIAKPNGLHLIYYLACIIKTAKSYMKLAVIATKFILNLAVVTAKFNYIFPLCKKNNVYLQKIASNIIVRIIEQNIKNDIDSGK